MPSNIEIKARIRDYQTLQNQLNHIAEFRETLYQKDSFYVIPAGRLKLREFTNYSSELIYYRRRNESGPKLSDYQRIVLSDSDYFREVLGLLYPIKGSISKVRKLFKYKNTRIHLDQVDGLGDFLEIEVVLQPDMDPDTGKREASQLKRLLGIRNRDLVRGSYFDLLISGK